MSMLSTKNIRSVTTAVIIEELKRRGWERLPIKRAVEVYGHFLPARIVDVEGEILEESYGPRKSLE